MRWIKINDALPLEDEDVYVRFVSVNGALIKTCGYFNRKDNEFICGEYSITEIGLRKTEWLDESEDTHTPDNTFRAEVAKSVLAALMSKEWSDMDLACEQAVKAADKLIQKLKQ